MTEPTPGLLRALLSIVLATRPRFDATVGELWSSLIDGLSAEESEVLAVGLTELIPLFVADRDHLRLLTDLLVAFDIFEAGPTLADIAGRRGEPDLLIAAAALAVHPGADPQLADHIQSLAARIEVSEMEQRTISIRLDPSVHPDSDLERILRAQVWPGFVEDLPPWLPPTVGVDDSSGSAQERWRALSVLTSAGTIVRRIAERAPRPGWLRRGTPIVTWDPHAAGRLHRLLGYVTASDLIVVSGDLRSNSASRALLQTLARTVPYGAHLLSEATPSDGVIEITALNPDVYHSGALDAVDMGVLAGGGRKALYEAKQELPPKVIRNRNYWSFNQLVALRTWQYFRSQTNKGRLSRSLLTRLSRFAGADDSSLVGVTATGHVLSQDEAGYSDIETGQRVLESVVALDVVFQPFRLGESQVPPLLTPSPHTRVHPDVLGGTPAIAGHRIGVRTVAMLARDTPFEDIASLYYPEVERAHLVDAIRLGRLLLDARS